LVELIEGRMGTLIAPLRDVIDTLAVGEPLELGSLSTITNRRAVEEAGHHGLITLDNIDGRIEARVAHPLYGEVRRNRAPATRLRRLRGLVATALAKSADADSRFDDGRRRW
jgi:hypothetical protein